MMNEMLEDRTFTPTATLSGSSIDVGVPTQGALAALATLGFGMPPLRGENRPRSNLARRGFTIVELMVAMALTLFIMVILSQAFILALDTFSGLKGIGDMQVNLRTAATTLRTDLAAYHFEGSRRISDPDIATNPPRQGFFMVYQGKPSYEMNAAGTMRITNNAGAVGVVPNVYEGMDTDGVHSYMAVNHVLYFTSRLVGNGYEDFYRTPILDAGFARAFIGDGVSGPAGPNPGDYPLNMASNAASDATLTPASSQIFASAWGEISYFLLQTGTTAEPDNPLSSGGTPLYGLYRAMYVVPTNSTVTNYKGGPAAPFYGPGAVPNFLGVSCNFHAPTVAALDFYTPDDLANAQQPVIQGANKAQPTDLRPTRTLSMVNNNSTGIANMPFVPPSLKWVTSTPTIPNPPGPLLVPLYAPPNTDPYASVLAPPNTQLIGTPAVTRVTVPPRGALQVLPNVLSFHVQIMPKPDSRFTTYPAWSDPEPQQSGASAKSTAADPKNGDVQTNRPRLYDTGAYYDPFTPNFPRIAAPVGPLQYGPYPYSVMAVQVTLRVWDPRSQQARQITIVQDM